MVCISYGCGKKGLPSVPKETDPIQIKEIKGVAHDGVVSLSWKLPRKKEENQTVVELKEFKIYRLSEDEEREREKKEGFNEIGTLQINRNEDFFQEIKFEDKSKLESDKWYHYVAACFDRYNNLYAISDTVDVFFSMEPEPPRNLKVGINENYIVLQWEPPLVDIEGKPVKNIMGYNVYRKSQQDKSFRVINNGLIKNEKYTDIDLEREEIYSYFVRAVDNYYPPWHESANSKILVIQNKDLIPPKAPTNLTVIGGIDRISLTWDKNVEPDLAGYRVYRSTTPGEGYKPLNQELISGEFFDDISVDRGIKYFYVVTAVDNAKNSNESSFSKEESGIAK